ncbi:hypothetical protein ASC58_11615 [Phycicoccus sp. Root101]|nr:hypothetical protein ASC58_11615 [Phycicoccus sp. Root101]
MAAATVTVLLLVAGGIVTALLRGDSSGTPAPEPSPSSQADTSPAPALLDALPGGFDFPAVGAGGWTVTAPRGARVEITTTTVHSGKGALSMTTAGTRGTATVTSRPQAVTPGQRYGAGALAIVTAGRPELQMVFVDSSGRSVGTEVAAATDMDGVWSRTAVESQAPAGAAAVRVTLVVGPDSAAVWDDVNLWTTALPDGGFEAVGASDGSPRSWTLSAAPGTSAVRITSGPHDGVAALQLQDGSTTGSAFAGSALVPVPTGAELEATAWARAVAGGSTLRVRWFDVQRRLLTTPPVNSVPAKGAAWSRLALRAAVPDGAAYVQVQIGTDLEGTATSVWDDVIVSPVKAAPEQSYAAAPAATMKGFANTKTSLVSSVGGVPKFSTVASGSPAVFQLADLKTGKVEYSHEIPGILNGWALTPSLDQRMIYIGGQGHVWRYDTASRSIKDLGAATAKATRVFDLVTAPDGRIWGGSYPGGEVWVLDPSTGRFTSAGSVGNDNDYARTLAVDAANVYVGTGSARPDIVQISTADPRRRTEIAPPPAVRTGFLTQLKVHDGVLSVLFPDGSRGLYDLAAKRWVDAPALATSGNLYQLRPGGRAPDDHVYYFRGGRFWGAALGPRGVVQTPLATIPVPTSVNGTIVRMRLDGAPAEWLVAHDGHTRVVVLKLGTRDPRTGLSTPVGKPRVLTIALRPTALRIKSLSASSGKIVVGGYGGSSLSILDPATLGRSRSPGLVRVVGGATTPKFFGEVEGMVTNGRYEFFGTYPKSRIFRLDTTQPWKPRTNPRMVVDLGATTDQDRPIAWATAGRRTFFGTIPDYGIRGGVLGWFEGDATTPVVLDPPVPDQSVVALSADRALVYGSTSRWGGLGSRPSEGPPSVFAYDADQRRLLWTVTPDPAAQSIGSVLHDEEGRLWAASRNRIFQLDPATGRTIRTIPLGTTGDPAGGNPDEGDPASATFVSTAMVSLKGHLYLAAGGEVLQVDPGTSRIRRIGDGGVSPARLAVVGDDLYYPTTTVLVRARLR